MEEIEVWVVTKKAVDEQKEKVADIEDRAVLERKAGYPAMAAMQEARANAIKATLKALGLWGGEEQ